MIPWNYTSPETQAWMDTHHDPKFKPKKYKPRKTSLRPLNPNTRARIHAQWEWERQRQIARYGPPTHLPIDPRVRAVAKSLEKNL